MGVGEPVTYTPKPRTKIAWVELHAPLFLNGTNLGQKIPSAEKKHPVKMEYDEDKRHLYVTYMGVTHRLPETGILSMLEVGEIQAEKAASQTPAPAFNPNAAQVETPTSHVFAGEGKGQTGIAEAFAKAGAPKK